MIIGLTVESYHPERRYLEHYLARELTKLGHQVNLITFARTRTVQVRRSPSGFVLHLLPYVGVVHGYHIPTLSAIKHIISLFKKGVLDVVHCQPLFSPISIIVIIIGRQRGSRIVGSLISGVYSIDSIQSYMKYILSKFVTERYLNRVTKRFFVKGNGLKKILQSLYNIDSSKIQVIPLGADHEFFIFDKTARIQTREELGIEEKDILILWSGSLTASKQVDLLLHALIPIIKDKPRVKLIIIGEGDVSYLNELIDISRNSSISKNVIFHDLVDFQKLPAFFSASDIAVWPGGTSISMLEAASCGLPIVSSRSPIEDYVLTPENALLFAPGDISELRRHLELLIGDNKLREEMGRNSRLLVERVLNWRIIANRYTESYENLR
jgi:1,2-diacylglycerol 3-alpha-glucosyltransferase